MGYIQLSKSGVYSINIPVRLVWGMKIGKGENCIIRKDKKDNEFVVTIERE
jgi:hypothetical protein